MTKWIPWDGGECPIPDAKAGEYEIRCSDWYSAVAQVDAKKLSWANPHPKYSFLTIVDYRLLPNSLDWLEGKIADLEVKGCSLTIGDEVKEHWIAREEVFGLIEFIKEARSWTTNST